MSIIHNPLKVLRRNWVRAREDISILDWCRAHVERRTVPVRERFCSRTSSLPSASRGKWTKGAQTHSGSGVSARARLAGAAGRARLGAASLVPDSTTS